MLTNNFVGKGAFRLIRYNLDPVIKAPAIDGIEVRIEKGRKE
jgi:hypothetical protein